MRNNIKTCIVAGMFAAMTMTMANAANAPSITLNKNNANSQQVIFENIPQYTKHLQVSLELSSSQNYSFILNDALNLAGVEVYTKSNDNKMTIYITSVTDNLTDTGLLDIGTVASDGLFNIVKASDMKTTDGAFNTDEWTIVSTENDNQSSGGSNSGGSSSGGSNSGGSSSGGSSSGGSSSGGSSSGGSSSGGSSSGSSNSGGSSSGGSSSGGSSSGGSSSAGSSSNESISQPNNQTTTSDGSTIKVEVDSTGVIKTEVTLSDKAMQSSTVLLPIDAVNKSTSHTIKVNLPVNSSKIKVPVKNPTTGTVAVLINADGSEKIIKTSISDENGVILTANNGETIKIIDNTKSFVDVSSSYWGIDAINFASSRELFNGTSSTEFTPEGNMTRSMIITVLARLADVNTNTGNTWYEAGVNWAKQNGISDGSNLDSGVSREQLATMLYRYAGNPSVSGNIYGFADAEKVSDWAKDAMTWAIQNGIITGMGDDTISPQSNATRAQVATMIMRFVKL